LNQLHKKAYTNGRINFLDAPGRNTAMEKITDAMEKLTDATKMAATKAITDKAETVGLHSQNI